MTLMFLMNFYIIGNVKYDGSVIQMINDSYYIVDKWEQCIVYSGNNNGGIVK